MTSDVLPPEAGLPIVTFLGSPGNPCQRPPPPKQPPPPIERACCRCLRCHATRGSSSNGRGGGWRRVTHSRSCGNGDVRRGGLDFNCAARRANWRFGSGSGSDGGGEGGDGHVGGCGAASTPAASASDAPTLRGRPYFLRAAAIGVRPSTAVGVAGNPFKPALLPTSEVVSKRRLPAAGSRSCPDTPPRAHCDRLRLSAASDRL